MEAATRDRILDVAQALTQQRGFNAFSYRDVATSVGIRAPSIHHYFPSKDDLGVALVERYREAFGAERTALSRVPLARERLRRYALLFRATLTEDGKMCLCGMLAAEFESLPKVMQTGVRGFFDENEAWLADLLKYGRSREEFRYVGSSRRRAASVLSTLEGAMLAARVSREEKKFDEVVTLLIDGLAS